MPRMRNPHTDEIADVIDGRAVVLADRGWEEVIEDSTPAAAGPNESEQVADMRAVANWLIVEAQHKRDELTGHVERLQSELTGRPTTEHVTQLQSELEAARSELAERPTTEQLDQVQADLDAAQTALGERPTADELAQLKAELEKTQADLEEATKPEGDQPPTPPAEGEAPKAAAPGETKPKAAPRGKRTA